MSKNGNDFVYWKNIKRGYFVDQFRIKSISYLNGIGKVSHSIIFTKGRTTRNGDRTKVAVKVIVKGESIMPFLNYLTPP